VVPALYAAASGINIRRATLRRWPWRVISLGGGAVAAPKTDWQSLQTLKNKFLDSRSEAEVKDWQQAVLTTFHGRAVMTRGDVIAVGRDRLKATHIVLAAGALPRRCNIPGAEHVCDSEHFLNLPDLSNQLVFIGDG